MGGPEVTLEDFPEEVLSGVILMDMQGLGKSWAFGAYRVILK